MRTTLTLDDDVFEGLQRAARRARLPLKTVANRALRLGLERLQPAARRPKFRQETAPLGLPAGTNLDKALQLAALLEDDERLRRME